MQDTLDLKDLAACRRCRRLQNQLKELRESHPDYWNAPVPPFGPANAPLLIVGLAPGMHGANRTGRAFTGDASGELLFHVLDLFGIREQVRITNAVKCLPVKNLPGAREINNCQRFLVQELIGQENLLILGGVAHRATIKALGARQSEHPFGHGNVHEICDRRIVDSYHCSRYNTQTGRLTEAMLRDVVELAAQHAGLCP
jgi:uracil-DNA glycosylase family 4